MELVKLFMLKHADAEPVIINNITFTSSQAEPIAAQLGASLVTTLEVLVRTLLVLQEMDWAPEASIEDKVHWRSDAVQKFEPA
jgi:adenosyl cobinamide kinase/adenosyl cobinamide phosphate guanylyltransferase